MTLAREIIQGYFDGVIRSPAAGRRKKFFLGGSWVVVVVVVVGIRIRITEN
jgi:hypothetical protein